MADYNQALIKEYRANQGKLSGTFGGMKLLLLTTTGAKSGQERTVPVAYSIDGDNLVVVASYGGAPTNPAWYYNLVANPEVTVELGDEKFKAKAHVTEPAERDRLFEQHAAKMPGFNDYKKKTTREIPVIVLERIS